MKQKLFLLALSVAGCSAVFANDSNSGPETNKKDELNGTVINAENKKPIDGVTVTAILVSKKEKSVFTDDDGSYVFDELRPGTYKFVFEKVGFKKITKEKVVIKTNEAFQMNIEMIENSVIEFLPSPLHFSDFR